MSNYCMEQQGDRDAFAKQLQSAILRNENMQSTLKKAVAVSSFNIDSLLNGYTLLHCAVIVRNINAVQLLQQVGARSDVQGVNKCTPLHFAVGNSKLMALLLHAQANPNLIDMQGNTPLHWAARENDKECARLLIEHGAQYLKNYKGEYPALAWMNQDALEQLKNNTEAAIERQKNERRAADERRRKEVEVQEVRLQARAEQQAREKIEFRRQELELRREEKRKRELAYAEHVEQVALENAPEIINRDHWTGNVLVWPKGSCVALWMSCHELQRIQNHQEYACKSIFAPHRLHNAYCKKCPFA